MRGLRVAADRYVSVAGTIWWALYWQIPDPEIAPLFADDEQAQQQQQ